MKRALVYVDRYAVTDSLGLLAVVARMYGIDSCETFAVHVGSSCDEFYGSVDHLLLVEDGQIAPYDAAGISGIIAELHDRYAFEAILIPATPFGRMLAPRIAARLHTGLVADVTEIRRDNGEIRLVRPAFSGRMGAAIASSGDGPVMLSVRPNAFAYTPGIHRKTEVTPIASLTVQTSPDRRPSLRLVERRSKAVTRDIRESDVLVSGGGGVMRSFDRLELLATELHGMVAASRRVIDSGKAPRHIQVGQSGKTVSPRLYIALGISGSIQHVAGIRNAEFILSVNSDRRAPICALSDIVVEGDAREFITRMVERIRRGTTGADHAHH